MSGASLCTLKTVTILLLASRTIVVQAQEVNVTITPSHAPSNAPILSSIPDRPSAMPSDLPSNVGTIGPTPLSTRCFSNTTVMNEVLERDSPFREKTYTLCPNTVYPIGVQADGECCTEGTDAIYPRANLLVQCGEDGKSSNNCVFTGGSYHVLSASYITGEPAPNVVIRGITFEFAALSAALLGNNGDITFEDCIFRNQTNTAAVLMAYSRPPTRRYLNEQGDASQMTRAERIRIFLEYLERLAQGLPADGQESDGADGNDAGFGNNNVHRELQVPEVMIATFKNCVFEYNTQSLGDENAPQYGVMATITGPANDIKIHNCTFRNNNFSGQNGVPDGFAVKATFGSPLEVTDTCFYDNEFTGYGTVQVYNGGEFIQRNNYASDAGSYCRFAAIYNGSELVPRNDADVTCVGAELDSCPFEASAPPAGSPTAAPVAIGEQPSSAPDGSAPTPTAAPVAIGEQPSSAPAATSSAPATIVRTTSFSMLAVFLILCNIR